jgi:hypothetical protein
MNENRLHGVIDMHIHSAPDVRERRLDDLQIMEAAIERGIRAVVIKSHMVPTMDRATLVNRIAGEKYGDVPFTMYGGITLNRSVGGLNPWAAEAACKLGAKVIWLPTMSAENHIQKSGKGPAVKVTEDGKIVEALKDIFQVAKDFDVVLATGHISDKECFVVAEAARAFGVRKLVVTHPEFWVVGMSLEDQIKIVRDYDVLLERVYAQPIGGGKYKKNLADNVEAVKAIGAAHLVVSTDGGQMQNPPWFETITEYVDTLYEAGFSAGDIRQMTHTNPARLLGIE